MRQTHQGYCEGYLTKKQRDGVLRTLNGLHFLFSKPKPVEIKDELKEAERQKSSQKALFQDWIRWSWLRSCVQSKGGCAEEFKIHPFVIHYRVCCSVEGWVHLIWHLARNRYAPDKPAGHPHRESKKTYTPTNLESPVNQTKVCGLEHPRKATQALGELPIAQLANRFKLRSSTLSWLAT